jgi:hypothetical protein
VNGTTPERTFFKNLYGLSFRIGSAMLDTGICPEELPDPSAKGGGHKTQAFVKEVAEFAADFLRGVRGPTVIHQVVSDDQIELKPMGGEHYYLVTVTDLCHDDRSRLTRMGFTWCRNERVQQRVLEGWKDLWRSGVRQLVFTESTWTSANYKITPKGLIPLRPAGVDMNCTSWLLVTRKQS